MHSRVMMEVLICLLVTDRTNREKKITKISKIYLNTIIYKFELTNLQSVLPPTDHLWGHKASLDTIQKTEIIQSIFSDHRELS